MKIKKGSLSHLLLIAVEQTANSGILESISYSEQMKYLNNLSSIGPTTKRSSLASAIRRVIEKGLLEQENYKDGKIILKLTRSGNDLLDIREEWDGKYRIVIWDIPENKRRFRDLLRRRLKEWGFKSWQKSVWVSKRNVTQKLRNLIIELEMDNWVVIIESDDSSLNSIMLHDRGSS